MSYRLHPLPSWASVLPGLMGGLFTTLAGLSSAYADSDGADLPTAQPAYSYPWAVKLGAAALLTPLFPGAKGYHALPAPAVEATYGDWFFITAQDGISATLFHHNGWSGGPVVSYALPRQASSDESALHGLKDVPFTVEVGGRLRYDITPTISSQFTLRQGINGHNGLIADWGLDLRAQPFGNRDFFLKAGPRLTYYDSAYARSYFGISSTDSFSSGYARFDSSGGMKAGAEVAAIYAITPSIEFASFVSYGRLLGNMANSPLIKGAYGSANQSTLGAMLTYHLY